MCTCPCINMHSTNLWSLQTFKHSPLEEGKRHSRHLGLVSHSLHLCCHLRSSRLVHGQNTEFTGLKNRIGWKKHCSVSAKSSCFSQFQRSRGISDIESLKQSTIPNRKIIFQAHVPGGWVFRTLKLCKAWLGAIWARFGPTLAVTYACDVCTHAYVLYCCYLFSKYNMRISHSHVWSP